MNGKELNLAENIKYFRELKNISKTELAERLKVSDVTVGYWETGRNKPRMGKIQQIADVLGISTDELVFRKTGYNTKHNNVEMNHNHYSLCSNKVNKIKILGKISAGKPLEVVEDVIDEILPPHAPSDSDSDLFGLLVKGDSMNKVVLDGNYAIFKKQNSVDNGDIAVVIVNGYNATLKKVYKFKDLIVLQPCSTNPIHEEQHYTPENCENIEILGKYLYSVSPAMN